MSASSKMNILLATNSKYIGPASVLVYSICKCHMDTDVDFYIAHHGLSEANLDRLRTICDSFIGKKICPLDVGDEFSKKITADQRFSYETYYRILALSLLPDDMDRILYLDVDMVVNGDLLEVYNTPFQENCPFKVCFDIIGNRDGAFDIIKRRAEIPLSAQYFNAGFLMINLEYIRYHRSVGYIIDAFYREYAYYPYHDQDILNHMYYDKVDFAPWALYNMAPSWWFLDTEALARGEVRYASYKDIHAGKVMGNPRYVDVTNQLCNQARVIHYMWILKPWNFDRDKIPTDLIPYTDIWFRYEKEMYEQIPALPIITMR